MAIKAYNPHCGSPTGRQTPGAPTPTLVPNTNASLVLLTAWPAAAGQPDIRELAIPAWRLIQGPLLDGWPMLEPATPWLTPVDPQDAILFDNALGYGENHDSEFRSKAEALEYLGERSLFQVEEFAHIR